MRAGHLWGNKMIYDKIKAIASEKNISIYRIERDLSLSNGPSVTTLKSVADYLRVPLEKLLED